MYDKKLDIPAVIKGNDSPEYKAFELLYDKYAKKIFGFLILNTSSQELAEELLDDIFLKIWDTVSVFDTDKEKRILAVVLVTCGPHLKKNDTYTGS